MKVDNTALTSKVLVKWVFKGKQLELLCPNKAIANRVAKEARERGSTQVTVETSKP